MKSLVEPKKTPRLLILREGPDGGWAEAHLASSKKNTPAVVVFSWEGGWDHVSVSFRNRTPTWEEMCEIKKMFFHPEEACVQYHPAESEYVNNHTYCLHIWRSQREAMPVPPSWMVGSKQGQSLAQAIKQGLDELTAMEAGQLASDPGAAAASQEKRERLLEYGA